MKKYKTCIFSAVPKISIATQQLWGHTIETWFRCPPLCNSVQVPTTSVDTRPITLRNWASLSATEVPHTTSLGADGWFKALQKAYAVLGIEASMTDSLLEVFPMWKAGSCKYCKFLEHQKKVCFWVCSGFDVQLNLFIFKHTYPDA